MLQHAESFDIYGTDGSLIASNGYIKVSCNLTNTAANVRTGNVACGLLYSNAVLKRALTNPATICGVGVGIQNISFSGWGTPSRTQGIQFFDTFGNMIAAVLPSPNAGVGIFDGGWNLKGRSAGNLFLLNVYAYVEAKLSTNYGGPANTGSLEVRINGATVLVVNGLNFPNQVGFALLGCDSYFVDSGFYVDDFVIWDGTGAQNNDFLGDRRCLACFPNANLATQNFTVVGTAVTAYQSINASPPVGEPNDTNYISGAAAGNVSEFSKTAISIAANDVAAVLVVGRLSKSDAGTATARLGINSNNFVANSADIGPGTSWGWAQSIVELDPNGNIKWTKAAVDAAALRITRSA